MPLRFPSSNAYEYPLLIKQLLSRSNIASTQNEIVSGTKMRLSYSDLSKRIRQLSNSLKDYGISEDMCVGVMDWDTHRYLEYFFAVPMMGATLFTINVRLSPAQVLYMINHSQTDLLIVHQDFMSLIDNIKSDFDRDIIIVKIGSGEKYEQWIGDAPIDFHFPDFDEIKLQPFSIRAGPQATPRVSAIHIDSWYFTHWA